jgi:excisionase family DNA binding protein
MGQGLATGAGGPAGMAAELAVGFGLAQQMMQQGLMNPQAAAAAPGAGGAAVPAVDLLSPADVAKRLNVAESDVMAIIETGELKAKKIGASYRITKAAFDAYLAQ